MAQAGVGGTGTRVITGIPLVLYPGNVQYSIEIQRTGEVSGAADPAGWATLVQVLVNRSQGGIWIDSLPAGPTAYWYRARHIRTGYTAGNWTLPVRGVAATLDNISGVGGPKLLVDALVESNQFSRATIGGVSMWLGAKQGHGIFAETFELDPALPGGVSYWEDYAAAGTNATFTRVATGGVNGGGYLRISGFAWRIFPKGIPYDPNKLYRIRAGFQQLTNPGVGGKEFYIGVECRWEDDVTYVDTGNVHQATNRGVQHWIVADGITLTAAGGWTEMTGYFKGNSLPVIVGHAGSSQSTLGNPSGVAADTRYIHPAFIANYNGGNGVAGLAYLTIEVMDEGQADSVAGTITGPGVLKAGGGQDDGVSSRALMRGLQTGTIVSGGSAVFNPPDQSVPIIELEGGIDSQPNGGLWGGGAGYAAGAPVIKTFIPYNATPSGFDLSAGLYQRGTLTARTDTSGGSTTTVGGTVTVTLANAPAGDGKYFVSGTITISGMRAKYTGQPYTGEVVLSIDSNDNLGSGWVSRATVTFQFACFNTAANVSDDTSFNPQVAVSGMTAGVGQIRLRVVSWTLTGPAGVGSAPAFSCVLTNVTYQSSTGDCSASLTPNPGDVLRWRSFLATVL